MILVVAATAFETEVVDPQHAETLVCGIGPIEAALITARAIAADRPAAVVHIGIAGAQTLAPGSLAVGTEAVYCDVIDPGSRVPRVDRVAPDADLLAAAKRALPHAHAIAIGTTGRVGGGDACEVEAMEGFGVLRAAQLAGVPAIELRAVSNAVAESDRAKWRVDEALAALRDGLPSLLEEIAHA